MLQPRRRSALSFVPAQEKHVRPLSSPVIVRRFFLFRVDDYGRRLRITISSGRSRNRFHSDFDLAVGDRVRIPQRRENPEVFHHLSPACVAFRVSGAGDGNRRQAFSATLSEKGGSCGCPRRTVLLRRPCGRARRQGRESCGTLFHSLSISASVLPPWTARSTVLLCARTHNPFSDRIKCVIPCLQPRRCEDAGAVLRARRRAGV